jgi:GntR family transcriptional regulator, histidine utilization repressor
LKTYKDIRQIVMERITSHEWPMGELIPNEQVLAKEFGVARATVNRAIQEIADAGFVERRRKAGTRVVPRRSRDAVVQIPVVREQIENMGKNYRLALIEKQIMPVTKAAARELSISTGTKAMRIVCLHFAGKAPWQLEERWINLAAVPAARDQDFTSVGPNEWLVREVPYSNAEHTFRAAAASRLQSRHLGLGAGAPVFVIERKTWQGGKTVTWVRLIHAGDRFSMVTRDEIPYSDATSG